jgi:glucoamylase
MEQLASRTGLLPEQVWDEPNHEEKHLFLGAPTGSAMPLMWAHAEYIKLLRSAHDRKVFDLIPEVADRYILDRSPCKPLEIWKLNRRPSKVERGFILRVQAPRPFRLHWSLDDWLTVGDAQSSPTALEIEFVDVNIPPTAQQSPLRFTFFWMDTNIWEGRDYDVAVE